MARKEVVSGTGLKFELNKTVTGIYRGMREGQFENAPLVDIEIGGEVKTYYGKLVLGNKLREVPENVEVEITFLGLKPNKSKPGKTFNDFSVIYDDGEPEEAAPAPAKPAPKPKPAAPAAAKPKPAPRAAKPAAAPAATEPAEEEVPF